jgi:hypothetical protein
MAKKFWIQDALNPKTKGALRKALGAKKGGKISSKKLDKAAHSKNALLKKRAIFAENMRKIREKRKSGK